MSSSRLPQSPLVGYQSWFNSAIEGDVLRGRTGLFGWARQPLHPGVPITWKEDVLPSLPREPAWWERGLYILGGVVAVVAGGLLILFSGPSFGLSAPLGIWALGLGLAAFGIGFGVVGAMTGDPVLALKTGAISGVAMGLSVLTAGMAAEFLAAQVGLTATAAVPGALAIPPALSGVQAVAAASAVYGISGYIGGMTYGLAHETLWGKPWSEALTTGHEYGTYGMAFGAAMPWVGAATRGIAGIAHASRASRGVPALTRIRRFFWDPRSYPVISRQYWAARGAAAGRSLHHWLLPQRARWIPQGLRNAGFNLVELPAMQGVFHRTLGLNQWMGFARNWGRWPATQATIVENAIRIGIPTTAAGAGYGGYQIGSEIVDYFEAEE